MTPPVWQWLADKGWLTTAAPNVVSWFAGKLYHNIEWAWNQASELTREPHVARWPFVNRVLALRPRWWETITTAEFDPKISLVSSIVNMHSLVKVGRLTPDDLDRAGEALMKKYKSDFVETKMTQAEHLKAAMRVAELLAFE